MQASFPSFPDWAPTGIENAERRQERQNNAPNAHTVANGIRCVRMDPITILTAMGMATEHLGLGATFSTTYFEPFHVARVFATLDLIDPAGGPRIATPRGVPYRLHRGYPA